MFYDEKDIDFLNLSDQEFEEVCFELLLQLGYKSLTWRLGGADSGRDIEGYFVVRNPLVDIFDEKWLFECKRYKSGVPPETLNSKIAWADAENPKHFVFFISSYITNGARTWLEKISADKFYTIHVIEGKQLKANLLRFPDLIAKYFANQYEKLLLDARKNWLIHDILPSPDTLSVLSKEVDPIRLGSSELGFLLCSAKYRASEIDQWIANNEPFYFDHLFYHLLKNANSAEPVISSDSDFRTIDIEAGVCDWEVTYPKCVSARIIVNLSGSNSSPRQALYALVSDGEGEAIEVLIEATGAYPTKIRHLKEDAHFVEQEMLELLVSKRVTS